MDGRSRRTHERSTSGNRIGAFDNLLSGAQAEVALGSVGASVGA